jgi:hypothetical protein
MALSGEDSTNACCVYPTTVREYTYNLARREGWVGEACPAIEAGECVVRAVTVWAAGHLTVADLEIDAPGQPPESFQRE